MRRVLITTIAVCAVALTAIALRRAPPLGLHVARRDRRPQLPAGAAGGAHDLPEDGQLAASSPRCSRSTPRRRRSSGSPDRCVVTFVAHAGLDGRRECCCRWCSWSAAAPGSCSRPRSGGCASRAASAASASVLDAAAGAARDDRRASCVVGSCAAIEAGVVATFGEGGAESGIVLAIWAIASLVGGLAFGHLPIGPWALAPPRARHLRRRGARDLRLRVLDARRSPSWSPGICLAPALAVMFSAVSASVKFSDTAEAYGWVGTGQLIGAAAGSAVAGFLIDVRSAQPDRGRSGRRRRSRCSALRGRRGVPPRAARPARARRQPDPRHRRGADAAELADAGAQSATISARRALDVHGGAVDDIRRTPTSRRLATSARAVRANCASVMPQPACARSACRGPSRATARRAPAARTHAGARAAAA